MQIKNLSSHLFWDVDIHKIDFDKNKKLIIQRALDYGLLSDWKIILDYYGIKEITTTAVSLKNLDKKSVSLISLLSGIPRNKFLCYTTKQLTPKHWNF
ncbi:MAG: hypothetical protein K8R31_03925 [Bacteroidales bacterium]|nr:hypothetical protein [Bacteroidales bacterium]